MFNIILGIITIYIIFVAIKIIRRLLLKPSHKSSVIRKQEKRKMRSEI